MLGLPKIESLREVPNILLERGITLKRGVDVEMGGVVTFLLLYSSVAITLSVCVGGRGRSKVSFITFWCFSLLS